MKLRKWQRNLLVMLPFIAIVGLGSLNESFTRSDSITFAPGVLSEPIEEPTQIPEVAETDLSHRQLQDAFDTRRSNLQIRGKAEVYRVLSDDNKGSRHQRFLLRTSTGQSILVAHNIDLAPRIPGIKAGDTVEFYGVYEYNDKGGVIHWTHHDPDGRHEGGWLHHNGYTYQ